MDLKYKGKLPPDLLFGRIVGRLPVDGEGVLLGPSIGEDAAILRPDGPLLAVHSDPVTGGGSLAGWLSVYVASNDIATRGIRPKWLLVVLLLREGVEEDELSGLVDQISSAAREIGAAVVGGHTEVTPGLPFSIVVTTAMGSGEEVINTRDARQGDVLVLTKAVALEGTAILATELRERLTSLGVDEGLLERASGFIREISVVRDAMIARRHASAMHDPTEGGLVGGVQEMALASGNGFILYEEMVPIREETLAICDALGIDPLRLISSGSLLISVSRERADDLVKELRRGGVDASIIGELVDRRKGMRVLRGDGREEDASGPVMDELWRALSPRDH